MTTITLEVPDELAARLVPVRDRLPILLSLALDLLPVNAPPAASSQEAVYPAFNEMIDFLASGPAAEQIVVFKVSPATQARLEELLDKNAEDGLTEQEAAELDVFGQINHILILLKARARTTLSPN